MSEKKKEPIMERVAELTPKGKKLFDNVQQVIGEKEVSSKTLKEPKCQKCGRSDQVGYSKGDEGEAFCKRCEVWLPVKYDRKGLSYMQLKGLVAELQKLKTDTILIIVERTKELEDTGLTDKRLTKVLSEAYGAAGKAEAYEEFLLLLGVKETKK